VLANHTSSGGGSATPGSGFLGGGAPRSGGGDLSDLEQLRNEAAEQTQQLQQQINKTGK
jgi:hypothetical protein